MAERLSLRDAGALLDIVARAFEARSVSEFGIRLMRDLMGLIPCETASFNHVEPAAGRLAVLSEPEVTSFLQLFEPFERNMGDHPLIAHYHRTKDGRAFRIGDFLSEREFLRTGIYNEFYRLVDVRHQAAFTLPAPDDVVIGVALNRSRREFTDRHMLLLNLLRRPLARAFQALKRSEELGKTLPDLLQDALESRARLEKITPREVDVVRCLSAGMTNAEIAGSLRLSVRTVQKHLENVYRKTRIATRSQLIAKTLSALNASLVSRVDRIYRA